jgi:hypothetical protein
MGKSKIADSSKTENVIRGVITSTLRLAFNNLQTL